MSSASRESAPGAPAVRQHAVVLLRAVAAIVVTCGFVFMAVKAWGQIERLIWRSAELSAAFSAAASLATTFPLRFVCLVLGSVGLMLAAEYRPKALLRTSTAAWVSLGVAGTGAFFLSALDLGSRWAFALVLCSSCAGAGFLLVRGRASAEPPGEPVGPSRARPLLPVLVGMVGGLLAVRASIEPVTEWDAVVYHVSFARDWLDALPGLPHAAGPSVGAELSYNYPALFPSVSVVLAGPLHLDVGSVARLVSPLAAVTVLAVLRSVAPPGLFAGWAASMFLLGSTFFVAYGQWPTAYMLMTLFLTLAITRVASEKRLGAATALCIGLAAATGWIGTVLGAMIVAAYSAWWASGWLRAVRPRGRFRPQLSEATIKGLLLAVPLGVVVVSSVRRTGGLFFPWVTWPHAAHLLPSPYWWATQREILANSYGQFDAQVGTFLDPVVGIARSGLLTPGGLAVQGVIVAAATLAFARGRNALLAAVGLVGASLVLLVLFELVWLRYYLPVVVAAAAGLGAAVGLLRGRTGKVERLAYAGAIVAASLSTASGLAYAVAGPNDRTYTAKMDYQTERASPFERARQAADVRQRRERVYGDDSRAWDEINRFDIAGVGVGTFDIRNYYSRYRADRQLDGLFGAAIKGSSGHAVAERLKSRGIDAVFIPSWFWEPGAARHPLADRSPISLWVGGPALRAVRVYLPDPYVTYPSVLYRVGSTPSARRLSALLDSPNFSVAGPLSSRRRSISGGFAISGPLGGPLHWRIAAPVTESGGPSIRVTTMNSGQSARGLTIYEPKVPTLVNPSAFVDCTQVVGWARESTLDITFPGSPLGFAYLDVGAGQGTRTISAVVRALPASDKILVHACGDPTTKRGGIFPAGSTAGRMIVEHNSSRRSALSFDYLDEGRRNVSFNVYDEASARWVYGVAGLHRCNSRRWIHAQLPIYARPARADTGTVEFGPVVSGQNLIVRNLRLVQGSRQTDCETTR